MAITYQGATSTSGSSLGSMPSHIAGDVLILSVRTTSAAPTTPSGWTGLVSAGFGTQHLIYYRIAADNSTPVPNVFASGVAGVDVLCYRGATTPIARNTATAGSPQTGVQIQLGAAASSNSWVGIAMSTNSTFSGGSGSFAPTSRVNQSSRKVYDTSAASSGDNYSGNWGGSGPDGAAVTYSIPIIGIPVASVQPHISGGTYVGEFASCDPGTFSNYPSSYTYQWQRNNVDIAGATNSTYLITEADRGQTIRCRTTAVNPSGSSSLRTSDNPFTPDWRTGTQMML